MKVYLIYEKSWTIQVFNRNADQMVSSILELKNLRDGTYLTFDHFNDGRKRHLGNIFFLVSAFL